MCCCYAVLTRLFPLCVPQAVIISLQTQLRTEAMKGQQLTLELANSKESVGPTIKALKATEDELSHTQRMLRTSEASNATLTNNLAALQQRASGIAIGEFRPNRPPQVSTTKGETPGTGVPTLPEAGDAEAEAAAKAEREAADALAGELLAVEAEEELPTSVDDLQRGMRHERARVRLLQAEVSQVRDEMAEQLERQRRGADRGLREMQTEFARLHRSHVEMKEAVNASEQRAGGEAGFRRRAEQGWLAAQQSLERTQAELQQSRIQVGELEGRLNATSDLSSELSNARKTITTLQGKVAADDARLVELLESQKLNSQHVAVAMGHAQQHAAAEFERLQAEHQASHQQSQQNASWWRQRAEKAKNKMGAAAASLSASRSSLESLLGRLVTATSVADMADQSRLLFEKGGASRRGGAVEAARLCGRCAA